jgi:hypothetical protein
MATTTTNFGWDIPQSTDLVKDGATAIAALGQDIDTAMVDLKGGTTGQVLAKASGTDLDFSWVAQDDSNAIQNAIVDAKGDLIAATAADTPARLAVGTNGHVLTADSAEATGIKWAAVPASDSYTSLATGSLSGASTTISSISSAYRKLVLVVTSFQGSIQDNLTLQANGNTGSNYTYTQIQSGTTTISSSNTASSFIMSVPLCETSSNSSTMIIQIEDYAAAKQHGFIANGAGLYSGTKAGSWSVGMFDSAAAISSLTLKPLTGTFSAGNYVLYGVK